MNYTYPPRHHPVFFLQDALQAIGIRSEFARDDRTAGCWGLVFPDHANRVMVWLIDNRLPHEQVKEDPAARYLLDNGNAIVCHAQKPDAERAGGQWLPLAASPGFDPYPETRIVHDVAFVGYTRDGGRMKALADVSAKFKLNTVHGVFGVKAALSYCAAKCGLNVPSHYRTGLDYDINMRVFEIPACRVPLVTNDLPELELIGFEDGKTCFTYGARRTIEQAIRLAIADASGRNIVADAGWNLIQTYHTYEHRAKQVKWWLKEPD